MDKVQKLHTTIRELRDLAKEHSQEATDPKEAVLCSMTGEVLAGLEESFDHYLHKTNKAWE